MLQRATFALVVFAATFAISMNDIKDLTGGCRKLCSNWNILSFDEFPFQIGRMYVIFERDSSKAAVEVGGSDVLSKAV